jgi:dethiobiotin synthetase
MTQNYIITGTDTGIGKTTAAAMLTLALDADYWKPIQSGTADGTDRATVQALTGLPDGRFLPEAYVFTQPLSPHRAAELDGVDIDFMQLHQPETERRLIIEGAGGLLVPINRHVLQADLFAAWGAPLILCCRTGLGTINHTLLSCEAIRRRGIDLHGLLFIGDDNPDNIRTIAEMTDAPVLGRLPQLERMDRDALTTAFADHFRREDF